MVMIFENLKKSWWICKCCVVVYLPTNFEKDWPTLLPDCFAWFSHRQALNNDLINYCFCVQITLRSRNYVLAIRLATLLIPRRHLRKRKSSQQKKRYKDFFKYIFILKPKQLFNIVYVNVCVKRFYSHKTSNNILFGYEKIPESRFSVPWSSLWWLKITYHIELEKRIPQIQIILLHSLTSAS
jgi:hypothetical protein